MTIYFFQRILKMKSSKVINNFLKDILINFNIKPKKITG